MEARLQGIGAELMSVSLYFLQSLVVIEFCAVFGSEAFVLYAKDIIQRIKTLKEFIHFDEMGRDKGILGKFFCTKKWLMSSF